MLFHGATMLDEIRASLTHVIVHADNLSRVSALQQAVAVAGSTAKVVKSDWAVHSLASNNRARDELFCVE